MPLLSAISVLWKPGITPDHPWADRRLVPVVLPAIVLASVAGVAWLARRAPARPLVAAAGAAVLLGPAVWGSVAVLTDRTEVGEPDAVQAVCDVLRPGDVVLTVDGRASNEWPQVIRGMCGNPAASVRVTGADSDAEAARLSVAPARRIADRVAAAGRRPVLLAAEEQGLDTMSQLGLRPVPAVRLSTTEDQRTLTRRPDGVSDLSVEVWLAPWP